MRVFLVGSRYVFPEEANRIIKAHLTENGAICVGEEYCPRGDKDFKDIVQKIKNAKLDVILNTVNGDSNIGFFLELKAGGVDCPVMSFSIAEVEVRNLGTQLTSGHYCAW